MNGADALLHPALDQGLGDHLAILFDDGGITYSQLAAAVCRCAHVLRDYGVGTQDRVLMIADDTPEFFYAYLGAMKIGAVSVAVNLRVSAEDLKFMIEDSGCKVILAGPEFLPVVNQAGRDLEQMPPIMLIERHESDLPNLPDLMVGKPDEIEPVLLPPEKAVLWLYTSGTTGHPKGVVHKLDMINSIHLYMEEVYGIGPEDRIFCTSKLFFAFSVGHILLGALRLGTTAVIQAGWPSADAVAAVVEKHRPTVFLSVPTMYRNLLRQEYAKSESFRSIRHFISAGEHLPDVLFHKWQAVSGKPILDAIGASEVISLFIGNRPEDYYPGSTGKPMPNTEIRMTTEDGEPIDEAGVPGIVWVRSGTVAAEYWKQEEKTAAAFQDGWYCSGDFFVRDAEGRYFYQGRGDDMLKISGQWVSPGEIERYVLENTKVLEAVVVGYKNEEGLTRLALCLATADPDTDHESLQQEITETLTENLSIYKCPRHFVFLDELPKTPTGKTQRYKLRQIAAEQISGQP